MRLPELAIRHRTFTLFAVFLLVLAGIRLLLAGPAGGARLHDQGGGGLDAYPGATPAEVERDVTDRIETKCAGAEVGRPIPRVLLAGGAVDHHVVIKPTYSSQQIPQVWNELRRKVGDVAPQLPKGAGPSAVGDDFGDVYGLAARRHRRRLQLLPTSSGTRPT